MMILLKRKKKPFHNILYIFILFCYYLYLLLFPFSFLFFTSFTNEWKWIVLFFFFFQISCAATHNTHIIPIWIMLLLCYMLFCAFLNASHLSHISHIIFIFININSSLFELNHALHLYIHSPFCISYVWTVHGMFVCKFYLFVDLPIGISSPIAVIFDMFFFFVYLAGSAATAAKKNWKQNIP